MPTCAPLTKRPRRTLLRAVGSASFACVKATEGGDYLNPNFAGDFAAVHDVRLGLHGPRDPMRWARKGRPYFAAFFSCWAGWIVTLILVRLPGPPLALTTLRAAMYFSSISLTPS